MQHLLQTQLRGDIPTEPNGDVQRAAKLDIQFDVININLMAQCTLRQYAIFETHICFHAKNGATVSKPNRATAGLESRPSKFHARLVSLRMISRIHETFFHQFFFTVLWRSTTFELILCSCNTYNHHEYGMESVIANCCHISF